MDKDKMLCFVVKNSHEFSFVFWATIGFTRKIYQMWTSFWVTVYHSPSGSIWAVEVGDSLTSIVGWCGIHVLVDVPDIVSTDVLNPLLPVGGLGILYCFGKAALIHLNSLCARWLGMPLPLTFDSEFLGPPTFEVGGGFDQEYPFTGGVLYGLEKLVYCCLKFISGLDC